MGANVYLFGRHPERQRALAALHRLHVGDVPVPCLDLLERLQKEHIRANQARPLQPIGDFEPRGSALIADAYDCSAWISPGDIVQLITRAIEAEGIGFFIAHGVSDNRVKRLDLAETHRVLGYQPRDDGFEVFPEAAKRPSSR